MAEVDDDWQTVAFRTHDDVVHWRQITGASDVWTFGNIGDPVRVGLLCVWRGNMTVVDAVLEPVGTMPTCLFCFVYGALRP